MQAAQPPPAARKHPAAAMIPNGPVKAPKGRHTVEAEAQAVPQQAKMQAVVAAGPLSTGGVLLRLINTMIDTKMTREFNETIFIISSCQLTRNCRMNSVDAIKLILPSCSPARV